MAPRPVFRTRPKRHSPLLASRIVRAVASSRRRVTERPNPLCMVGAGYVGLVTAVCLADAGVDVRLLDIDAARLEMLRGGKAPIHEPLLDDLLAKVLASGRLALHADAAAAMRGAAVIMIAVGTPPLGDGRADLTQVRAAVT